MYTVSDGESETGRGCTTLHHPAGTRVGSLTECFHTGNQVFLKWLSITISVPGLRSTRQNYRYDCLTYETSTEKPLQPLIPNILSMSEILKRQKRKQYTRT